MKICRRDIIKSAISTPLLSISGCTKNFDDLVHSIQGTVNSANHKAGHFLREKISIEDIENHSETDVLIVGAGAGGLSCAYHLNKIGLNNFKIIDLESNTGGNARSESNQFTSFPLGAHYVTVANLNSQPLLDFYTDTGVITGFDNNGVPFYNIDYLCQSPVERIYNGKYWELNYLPYGIMSSQEKQEVDKFYNLIEVWMKRTGKDQKPAFTIPMEDSSKDPEILSLDNISFSQFLNQQGLTSTPLVWYIDYCCRDDFGAHINSVSAWAGLHYFCARQGYGANTGEETILTWPEGNQWLINQLKEPIKKNIRTNTMAISIEYKDNYYYVTCRDSISSKYSIYKSKQLVMASPKFVNKHLLQGVKEYKYLPDYAPWVVSTITCKKVPGYQHAQLSWDNFNYLGKGLGYIYAQHQTGKKPEEEFTLSYYWPITHLSPQEAREWMLSRRKEDWNLDIVKDLESMNMGISEHITSINTWLWGHAMAIPKVGTLWSGDREADNRPENGLHFAHSDMSGFSIFEEAFYRGYKAAKSVEKILIN